MGAAASRGQQGPLPRRRHGRGHTLFSFSAVSRAATSATSVVAGPVFFFTHRTMSSLHGEARQMHWCGRKLAALRRPYVPSPRHTHTHAPAQAVQSRQSWCPQQRLQGLRCKQPQAQSSHAVAVVPCSGGPDAAQALVPGCSGPFDRRLPGSHGGCCREDSRGAAARVICHHLAVDEPLEGGVALDLVLASHLLLLSGVQLWQAGRVGKECAGMCLELSEVRATVDGVCS